MELNIDTEGGHYASDFININKGAYEGQLVIGDSFVHPIKEFTVSKNDDIIVLQFKITKGVCEVMLAECQSEVGAQRIPSTSFSDFPSVCFAAGMGGGTPTIIKTQ